jgi:hypothetical protein
MGGGDERLEVQLETKERDGRGVVMRLRKLRGENKLTTGRGSKNLGTGGTC